MRDNCFKIKNTFIYTIYLLSNKYSQIIYSYHKAGGFYRFNLEANTATLSIFNQKDKKSIRAKRITTIQKYFFAKNRHNCECL